MLAGDYEVKKEFEDNGVIVKKELVLEEENQFEEEKEEEEETKKITKKRVPTFQRCAYCYGISARENMVSVPGMNYSKLPWVDSLGLQFWEYLKMNRKNAAVCKKHFEPELAKFSENRLKKIGAVPRPDPRYEGRKLINVSAANRINKNVLVLSCAYCCAEIHRKDGRLVPESPVIRELWVRKLGEQFRNRISGRTNQYICKSHLPESTLASGRIPKHILPYNLAKTASDATNWVEKLHEGKFPIPIADMEKARHECSYCLELRNSDEMVDVPMDRELLEEWCSILGISFEYNIFNKAFPMICASHFEKGSSLFLPTASESCERYSLTDNEKGALQPDTKICSYCATKDYVRNMRAVPDSDSMLKAWTEILGKEFKKNCEKQKEPAICRSHFFRNNYSFANSAGMPVASLKKIDQQKKNQKNMAVVTPTEVHNDVLVKKEESCDDWYDEEKYRPDFSEADLKQMYKFGYENLEEMYKHEAELAKKRYFSEHTPYDDKMCVGKCVYCLDTVTQDCSYVVLTEEKQHFWKGYARVFGRQYLERLKSTNYSCHKYIMKPTRTPIAVLCSHHFNSSQKPVMDMDYNYSIDALLDHTYADFSVKSQIMKSCRKM